MLNLTWYWHRLRAMSPGEMAQHARKKFRQFTDARHERDWAAVTLAGAGLFPKLPLPDQAPAILREALRRDADDILAGRWQAFGHLELQVDDPPKWHCDYLVGQDLTTDASAFKLNHRALPGGADIKLIWELSRWYHLTRLAMAAYVLDDERAARKCVAWLEDWVQRNPPYRGWNWTSALESGLRLVQFTWMDALLSAWNNRHAAAHALQLRNPESRTCASLGTGDSSRSVPPHPSPLPEGEGNRHPAPDELEALDPTTRRSGGSLSPGERAGVRGKEPYDDPKTEGLAVAAEDRNSESLRTAGTTLESRLETLRHAILPPHIWFTWRHRSFGSSANNHLLGELAGLILATVRWPALARWGASLDALQRCWEREVLAQFAEDGGNREQALSYHLFSWEFCWQARSALHAGGGRISPQVEKRLAHAAGFEVEVRADHGPDLWDTGDSDNATVCPLFASQPDAVSEWHGWLLERRGHQAIGYWIGDPPHAVSNPEWTNEVGPWRFYESSGIALHHSPLWVLRWDLSPLGYLATAAHGHLDALHLSIWFKETAIVVDPGTAGYYLDRPLRDYLTSASAHNGPFPGTEALPKRLGPFLWSQHHHPPTFRPSKAGAVGTLNVVGRQLRREIRHSDDGLSWLVEDQCVRKDGMPVPFVVRWQFAPGAWVKRLGERRFSVHRAQVSVGIEVSPDWVAVELVEPAPEENQGLLTSLATEPLEGIVSPAFRKICRAPFLKLTAAASDKPCVFRTTFLASSPP